MRNFSKLSIGSSLISGAVLSTVGPLSFAKSRSEVPFIMHMPKVDGSDFYMFRSYEAGKEQNVSLIANYVPLQDSYCGFNHFMKDPIAVYEIKIDNNGDSVEDLTYQFRFTNTNKDTNFNGTLLPLVLSGAGISTVNDANANVGETYTIDLIRGSTKNKDRGTATTMAGSSVEDFDKPFDNIGKKTIPDYARNAGKQIYPICILGCWLHGRVFVGQRKESFVVNLGEVIDLINLNPLGAVNGEKNYLDDKNVTEIALEISIGCLTASSEKVIGGRTAAKIPQTRIMNEDSNNRASLINGKLFTQMSRLGMPLVNKLIIGLKDKDRYNKLAQKMMCEILVLT